MNFTSDQSDHKEKICSFLEIDSVNKLLNSIPEEIKNPDGFDSKALEEIDLVKSVKAYSEKNRPENYLSFLGGGVYNHFIPSVVKHLSSQHQFITSYTQYQPEVSQGMLEVLFEFQTYISRLTGMYFSNSSHYDGACAFAEAVLMGIRRKKGAVVISKYLNPYYKKVLYTYLDSFDVKIYEIDSIQADESDLSYIEISVLALENINFLGVVENLKPLIDKAKSFNATVIVSVNILSLLLFKPPGELGADIVTGDGQSLGQQMNYGGPAFGFIAATKNWIRKIPGRLVGMTNDRNGKRGYVLTLQAREQHIRREKAISNICTNQASCAVRAAIFISSLGSKGLTDLSYKNYQQAHTLKDILSKIDGVDISDNLFFNEFTLSVKGLTAKELIRQLRIRMINGGIDLSEYYPEMKNNILIAVTEMNDDSQLKTYKEALEDIVS